MAARITPSKGSKPDKLMRDAILLALNREVAAAGRPTKKLTLIADKLVDLAVEGNMAAIKEICDRADGRPSQPVASDPESPLAFTLAGIKDELAKKLARLADG